MEKWPESRIREELKRLDRMTGLHGSELPIRFTDSKRTLGMYFHADSKKQHFAFSRHYFENPDFSNAEALDTIRHEYAHFMVDEIYGANADRSHGNMWKACCRRVGARPQRLYNAKVNQTHLNREQAEQERENSIVSFLDSIKPGTLLNHPSFGAGRVTDIDKTPLNARVTIRFDADQTCRRFGAQWVAQNCTMRA